MYELPDNAPLPWLDQRQQQGHTRHKRFISMFAGVAALGLAWHVSNRVDVLQEQTDSLKNSYVSVANSLVEVSNKLNTNIALVNSRIDDQVKRIKKNNNIIDVNFAMMRDVMMRNTEAAMRDTNVKFAVMASYQMWYAQMQSVTHQMMQAAMYTKFMAKGWKTVCGRSRQSVRGAAPAA
ncbi:hypothetical protein DPEC_G00377230 [Dallia pectoralis]|nr:hypothetical protein DPEC_G00377230 [Dallia pectoralis]